MDTRYDSQQDKKNTINYSNSDINLPVIKKIEMQTNNLIHIKPGKQMIQINPAMGSNGKGFAFRLGNGANTPSSTSQNISNVTPSPRKSTTSTLASSSISPLSPNSSRLLNSDSRLNSASSLNTNCLSPDLHSELKEVRPNEMTTALNGRFIVTKMSKNALKFPTNIEPPSSPPTDNEENYIYNNSPIHSPGNSQSTDEGVFETPNEPSKKHPKWSSEDDKSLRAAVLLQGGRNWKEIAKMMDNKFTETQCLNRYKKVLNPNVIKGPWTPEEDQKLVQLVNQYGAKKWSVIASKMAGRISKQCRERWVNALNPEINKGPWTEDEDYIIEKAHEQFGNKWSRIVAVLKKHGFVRTDNGVKNHWNSTMRRERERKQEGEDDTIKRRKYYGRKNTNLSSEVVKTPKKRKYPNIVMETTTESDEVVAIQRRAQQETLNGLLVPNLMFKNDDYKSILVDPTLYTNAENSLNATAFPSEVLPSVLKPHQSKRSASNLLYNHPVKRRKFSSQQDSGSTYSSDNDNENDQPVSRCLDFSQANFPSEDPTSPMNDDESIQEESDSISQSPTNHKSLKISTNLATPQSVNAKEPAMSKPISVFGSSLQSPISMRPQNSIFTPFPLSHPVFSQATRLLSREEIKI